MTNKNRKQQTAAWLGLVGCTMLLSPAAALAAEVGEHSYWFNLRLRNEQVHQRNALRDANAVTLRTRIGFESKSYAKFRFLVEGENIFALDDSYNSTTNGETNRSVVPDPEDTELNRFTATYSGIEDTVLKLGRQRIVFDNSRFIGNVGWRQNEQTFDALTISNSSLKDVTARFGYIDKVRRIFGPDSPIGTLDLSAPIFNVSYTGLQNATLTFYGYFLEFEDAPQNSQRTLGARLSGKTTWNDLKFRYQLELADQSDYANGLASNDANYLLAYLSAQFQRLSIGVGHERLSGDGTYGFQTPLATGHAFNGWSDQFLVTPATGLLDTYVDAGVKVKGFNIKAVYHQFDADRGSQSYGSEFNFIATRKLGDRFSAGIKFADYEADQRGIDTTKLWLFLQFTH